MRLTARDKRILEAIHAYDGMLGFSQIRRMFFTGRSQTEERLKLLYQHKYVNRPNRSERMRLPEMIYWLDKPGAELVASLNSIFLKDFQWKKKPRWFQVEHDLAVNDFKLDVIEACHISKNATLESWIPESNFLAYPDRITYSFSNKTVKRYIRPDGFFILRTHEERLRYLLEIDRGTEDNPRFLREKIVPGLAYLKSQEYEKRFGHRSGRWLVVTTTDRRLNNMLRQARRRNAKWLFYFTTFNRVSPKTLFFSPIWYRSDQNQPVPLLPSN